jgi:SHS2 domain-containing protein
MYRFAEHTGEVEIAIAAATEAGVFEEALMAMGELIRDEPEEGLLRRTVDLSAGDRASLLVEWLSEFVFLAEVESFVPERVTAFEFVDDRLHATVEGRLGRPSHLVKAVTLNSIELRQEDGTWHGRVVLDV